MLRLPHSARWDITNICNFPPPSQTSQTFAKYWKKPPRSLYLDKLFLQRKSSRYFQTIRFASLHLSEFVQNCAPSNLSDECFHRFAFIQFVQRWVDLIDARLSGQIGKMSNLSPIYRSWNNWRNMVKVVTYPSPVKDPICQNCEFEPKGNPFHPLCAAACAHRRKWGFGEGSCQLIGFGTQEYTKESTNTLSDTKLK